MAKYNFKSEPIYFIPLKKLQRNRIQPRLRTHDARLRSLEKNIRECGQIYTPGIAVPGAAGQFIICDGHRRWRAAEELGHETLPVRVIDNGIAAETLFLLLNGDTARLTGADWCCGWARGNKTLRAELCERYPRRANVIAKAIEVFGEERVIELGKTGKYDPASARRAIELHAILTACTSKGCPSLRKIGEWLLNRPNRGRGAEFIAYCRTTAPKQRVLARIIAACQRSKEFPTPDKWSR